ncbi:MAG: hypothetical protein MK066_04800 [Crocinitomicaceae bacterium]|nr:hypothetical protein [Crocinitomicaceae bacterium]
MLNKLLFKNQDMRQLIIAIAGAFLGITFLITSIHYLIKVNEFGKGTEILGPNTIIVQKKVSNSSTLGLTKTDFSIREIEKIKANKFIADAQPVISNNFDVYFATKDSLVPRFRTDVFIQTVDPDFLDVKLDKWDWKPEDEFIPMIMPREFLVMLNTFMSAQNIPQISDDLVKQINCEFCIGNGNKKEWRNARVVGFTNEVSSILVPESLMEYGNNKYSLGKEKKITQIMISGKEGEFGLVEELMEKRGLESKNAQMIVGRLKSIVGTLFLVVLGISIIAVFVSGLVLIQFMQLLISRNTYEVRTLMRLGYHPKKIIKRFFIYFVKIFGIVTALGFTLFFVLKYFLDSMFASGGIYIDTGLTFGSIGALILAYLLFSLASYFNARKGIFKEY